MNDSAGYDRASTGEFYDHIKLYRDRGDVQFFVEEAVKSGGPVLELGSGTGRVLIPTARAGIAITGLDASSSMLDRCRESMAAEPQAVIRRITLHQGDMRNFNLDEKFQLITLPFRPFQHLITVQEQIACLQCVAAHLVPGGRVILDLFNPSLELLTMSAPAELGVDAEFTMPDGRKVTRRGRIAAMNRATQVNDVELIYTVDYPDGRQEELTHAFPMRYFFRYEVEHLLARCGLELLTVYAGFTRAPFGSVYPGELICIARTAG